MGLPLQAAQDRARAFKRTADRCHSQINELQAHVNSLFQGVTTNRQASLNPVSSHEASSFWLPDQVRKEGGQL